MQDVIEKYAAACGFSFEEIIGTSRRLELSLVRQLIWKKLRDSMVSCSELARLFNRRSRSGIIHGVRRVGGLLEIGDRKTLEYQKRMDDVQNP